MASNAYAEDLARVHDLGFGELAREAAELAVSELGERRDGPVVDLGCGGGITLRCLADAGHRTIGIDISPAQIALARDRVPEAELRVGSVADADLPRECLAVLAIGEIVNYDFDDRGGEQTLSALIERAAGALAPGGILLFDCAGPGRGGPDGGTSAFSTGEGWAVLYEAQERTDPPLLTREITTFTRDEADTATWRRAHETHELRLIEPAAVVRELQAVGFEVERRSGYDGGARFAPGLEVFLARLPRG